MFYIFSSDMKPRPFYRKVVMKVLIRLTTFFFLRTPFQGKNYTKIKIHKMTVFIIFIQCIKKYNKEENTQGDKGGFIKINKRNSRQGLFSFGRNSEKYETTQWSNSNNKQYEVLLRGENKRIISIVSKTGELLQKRVESEDFFINIDLSWSNLYFKIQLCKFLSRFPALKVSMIKTNLKLI